MKILVLNSGSSSQKACLYEIGDILPEHPPACLWEGRVEFEDGTAAIAVKNSRGVVQKQQIRASSREQIVKHLLGTLSDKQVGAVISVSEIEAVGHRVVHGGPDFEEPVMITREVRSAINSVSSLAPLHIRAEVEGMELVERILGSVPQMAVFDTGFHRQMPLEAATYPGPYHWFENGIRRYGFHGVNHQYCTLRAGQLLNEDPKSLRVISCHLGNGCSVAAIHGGRSIDTTMGFTPLDGLMMGTRCGSVDPGILLYLMRKNQLDSDEMNHLLNEESGLFGISGISGDMREILAAVPQGHERAKLAFDIFVHRLRQAIGGMAAVLGGVDSLVFTAGVGENSWEVRAAACDRLGCLGIKLDSELNLRPSLDADISAPDSRVRILVIRAEEDWAIATECWKLARAASVGVGRGTVAKNSLTEGST